MALLPDCRLTGGRLCCFEMQKDCYDSMVPTSCWWSVSAPPELYTVASIAYVGGGFHGKGLHSVLEPAAAGVPVLFGPHHQNSLAASDLLACGGAMVVGGADGLANVLQDLLGDADKLEDHGGRARNYIAEHQGAAGRTADLLVDCLTEQA